MSDSVKKYFDMVEDGLIDENQTKTPLHQISEKQKEQAYRILTEYDDVVIKYAFHKLMFGE